MNATVHVTGKIKRTDTATHSHCGKPVEAGPDVFTREVDLDATIAIDIPDSYQPSVDPSFADRFSAFLTAYLQSLTGSSPLTVPPEFASALAAYLASVATDVAGRK